MSNANQNKCHQTFVFIVFSFLQSLSFLSASLNYQINQIVSRKQTITPVNPFESNIMFFFSLISSCYYIFHKAFPELFPATYIRSIYGLKHFVPNFLFSSFHYVFKSKMGKKVVYVGVISYSIQCIKRSFIYSPDSIFVFTHLPHEYTQTQIYQSNARTLWI